MESKEFIELCNLWDYSSWQKGKLIDYWKKAGLSVETILENRNRLGKQSTNIAVLGSVGKSTLVRVLSTLLHNKNQSYYVTKVNDNWLPQLPFAVELALRSNANLCVFECGVASRGDATLMASVVPADIVIYTEFTEVNLLQLGSLEGIAEEKTQFVLQHPGARVVSHIANWKQLQKMALTYSFYGVEESEATLMHHVERMTDKDTTIRISGKKNFEVKLGDIGIHLGNACCGAIASYLEAGRELKDMEDIDLSNYKNPRQRMQSVEQDGIRFIIDTANANRLSILNSLETLILLDTDIPRNAVIGGIYGLGGDERRIIKDTIEGICEKNLSEVNTLHFVGNCFLEYQRQLSELAKKVFFYKSNEEFKTSCNFSNYKGQIMLLRGPTKIGVNLSQSLRDYDSSSEETTPSELLR